LSQKGGENDFLASVQRELIGQFVTTPTARAASEIMEANRHTAPRSNWTRITSVAIAKASAGAVRLEK
jgi:hypothetical protein